MGLNSIIRFSDIGSISTKIVIEAIEGSIGQAPEEILACRRDTEPEKPVKQMKASRQPRNNRK